MPNEAGHSLDATEEALYEFHQAESAGVFERTRVDFSAARIEPAKSSEFRPATSWSSRGVMLGLAATLLMTIGVWTAMFGYQLSRLHQQAALTTGEVVTSSAPGTGDAVASSSLARTEIEQFERCLAGPGDSKDGACRPFDYDRNGRIDLHDFSARQRATLLASN